MDYKELKKAKILFHKDNQNLSVKDIENLLNSTQSNDEKWFFRGCKHILERHYTEAIKNLQLSNTKDATLLILLSALKLADGFLVQEYNEELSNQKNKSFSILTKYNIKVYLFKQNEKISIDEKSIQILISSVFNR